MIRLEKINENNFIEAFNLKLNKEQEKYVSHPIRSLAQAYVYYHQCTPFGIYNDGVMVGYVMVIYDYDLNEYNIWHMMIDESKQHRGYGKKALTKCLEYIKSKPFGEGNRIVLTCNIANENALSLYKSFGFKESGNKDEDEIELYLNI